MIKRALIIDPIVIHEGRIREARFYFVTRLVQLEGGWSREDDDLEDITLEEALTRTPEIFFIDSNGHWLEVVDMNVNLLDGTLTSFRSKLYLRANAVDSGSEQACSL